MIDLLVFILAASALPAAFAVTAAHRAGAASWRGVAVWCAEATAQALIRWARHQREYATWREDRCR